MEIDKNTAEEPRRYSQHTLHYEKPVSFKYYPSPPWHYAYHFGFALAGVLTSVRSTGPGVLGVIGGDKGVPRVGVLGMKLKQSAESPNLKFQLYARTHPS